MKRQADIDRTLEAFFLDGPSQMPDRLFDAVLDRVERVPQRRLARLQLRFNDMPTTLRWVAAAAAAVLVVGVGFAALGRTSGPGPGTTPSPSASESPIATGAPGSELPAALQHPFIGPLRTVDELPAGNVSQLEFTARSFVYHNGTSELLRSVVGLEGDELVLRSGTNSVGCDPGTEGRYPVSTSPGGSTLTIAPGSDDCAPRLAVLPGTWQRSDCTNRDNWCLGIVEAGTYSSQYFDPDAPTENAARPSYGRLTWTVPDGWANSADWPGMYEIMRASSYAAGGVNEGAVTPDVITLLARASAARLHAGCAEEAEPGIGTDRAALAGWLSSHPGLVVTQQPVVTIDGLEATVLDVAMATDWTESCGDTDAFIAAPLFYGGYHWAIGANDRMRIVLLDLPSGMTVVITIDVEDVTTFDAFMIDAMPIVESFDFQ